MPNYQKMYRNLFNSVTEAIEILQKAQIEAEEEYINSGENESKRIFELKMINKNENNSKSQNFLENTKDKV